MSLWVAALLGACAGITGAVIFGVLAWMVWYLSDPRSNGGRDGSEQRDMFTLTTPTTRPEQLRELLAETYGSAPFRPARTQPERGRAEAIYRATTR